MSDSLQPMDCSVPGFPVHHQLQKLTQAHAHRSSDATQPSHPLSSSSPPTFNLSRIRVYSNESVPRFSWPKYWNFSFSICPSNDYSGLISVQLTGWIDWLDLCSPRDSQECFPTPQLKSISSLAFSFLYSPTLTSIHDYWKNHSFDYMDLYW